MSDDPVFIALFATGLGSAVAAHIWVLLLALRTSRAWGIAGLLIPGALLVFAAGRVRRCRVPLGLALIGWALAATAWLLGSVASDEPARPVVEAPPGVRVRLTGEPRENYAASLQRGPITYLQWANADVTDADAVALVPLDRLEFVDLNGTQITDATLERLAALPKLQVVKIARTKATAAGVRQLLGSRSVRDVDVRGLPVSQALLLEWLDRDPAIRRFAN